MANGSIPVPSGFEAASTSTSTVAAPAPAPATKPATSNGFVSFIKKLGSMFNHGVQKAIAIEQKALPAEEVIANVVGQLTGTSALVTAGEKTFESIFGTVVQVEQVATAVGATSGTGVQKLAVALPQVEQAILANPLFAGKVVIDTTKWNNAISAIAGAMYDLGNAVAAPSSVAASKS